VNAKPQLCENRTFTQLKIILCIKVGLGMNIQWYRRFVGSTLLQMLKHVHKGTCAARTFLDLGGKEEHCRCDQVYVNLLKGLAIVVPMKEYLSSTHRYLR